MTDVAERYTGASVKRSEDPRILTGRTRATGVAAAGAIFDAPDFLRALSSHLSLHLPLDTQSSLARATPEVGAGEAAIHHRVSPATMNASTPGAA